MFRKISAVLAAFALSLGISFGSAAAASANENAPVAPVVNFTKATVAGETDKLTVTWPSEVPAAEQELYRYLVFIDNNYVLQLNKEFRRQLHTTGIDLAGLQQKYGAALDTYAGTFAKTRYDLNIKVRPFYFDKNKKYTGLAKERHVPAVSGFGGKPVEFIPLGDTAFFKLTDPATLSAPKQTARPNAIDFSLGTMACVAGQPQVDEFLIKLGDNAVLEANHRFVATVDGKSISLNAALRDKLNAEKQLTLADFKAAYPAFDSATYHGKTVMVQSYFFDKEKAYDPALYANLEPLVAGTKLDRFIALGEAKTVVFNTADSLQCGGSQLITQAPAATVDFVLGSAACVAGQPQVDEFLIKLGDNAVLEANHRLVATVDGKSISLNAALRDKLNAEKQLTLADFKAAYPAFDSTTYHGKTVMVQSYFFDKEKAYDPALYANLEPLVAGTKLDRFIALGEAKTAVFGPIAKPDCASENDQNVVPVVPEKPAASTAAPGAAKTLAKTGTSLSGAVLLSGLGVIAGASMLVLRRKK